MKIQELIVYARKFCVALTAALVILGAAVSDGVMTGPEWIQVIAAFLGALGVYQVANEVKK